jgi:uncharacterized protein (DUF2345 family)
MNLTEEEFKKLKKEIIDDLEEDYFVMRRPGFNIESNYVTQAHGVAELSITTDENQGVQFYKKGNAKILANKSIEMVAGKDQESEKSFTIVLDAKTGNILLSAKDGDLILEGGNVKIIATDEDGDVYINSQKTLTMNAPEINAKGTKVSMTATSDMHVDGGTVELYSQTGSTMFSSGQDEFQTPTSIGTLINFVANAKKRLGSIIT